MGLEQRGGGFYFYQKVRRGGRVVSEYMGGGPSAPLMAQMAAFDREREEMRREDWKADRERMDAEDARAVDLFDRVEAVVREILEAAGYHRHNRGDWRKRRGTK